MSPKDIEFFSPEDNIVESKLKRQKAKPSGYTSQAGKLLFPEKSLAELGINSGQTSFKIGTQAMKRELKYLYLIPDNGPETFPLERSSHGNVIALGWILNKQGLDFEGAKYKFAIETFDYHEGMIGYQLELQREVKAKYTGKPRGRRKALVQ